VVVEVDEVGDGVGVADGGDSEGRGAVVEVVRGAGLAAAEVLFAEEWREARGAGDHAVEIAAELEVRREPVEDGGKARKPSLEVLLEVVVQGIEARVGIT